MAFSRIRHISTRTSPLIMNMFTCGSLYGLGDLSQQTLFKPKDEKYDLEGTKRIATLASFGLGPIFYYWYKWLDHKLPGTAVRTVAKKLVLDQVVCSPVCLLLFFVGLSYMEGKEDILREFKEKGPKTYVTSCAFWPAAQIANFTLCPPYLRTVYVSSCAFLWSNVLCYIKGDGQSSPTPDTTPVLP